MKITVLTLLNFYLNIFELKTHVASLNVRVKTADIWNIEFMTGRCPRLVKKNACRLLIRQRMLRILQNM